MQVVSASSGGLESNDNRQCRLYAVACVQEGQELMTEVMGRVTFQNAPKNRRPKSHSPSWYNKCVMKRSAINCRDSLNCSIKYQRVINPDCSLHIKSRARQWHAREY
jgi:hypothetical protein